MTLGSGVPLIGGMVSAMGAIRASNAQVNAIQAQAARDVRTAEAQARLRERDAALAEREVADEVSALAVDLDTIRRQFRRVRGEQEAAIGAAGLEFTGSPLDVLVETAGEAQFELERARFQSEQTQQALQDTAAQARFEAEELRLAGTDALAISRRRAKEAREAGRLTAAGAMLGGAATSISMLQPRLSPAAAQPIRGGAQGGFAPGVGAT